MTIEFESIPSPSPIVRTDRVTLYPAKVPFKHPQLRSLLCAPAPNILYYPCDHNIFCLDTKEKRRELVASLPFAPRSLVAGHGWLCAGGDDKGRFAAIKVGKHCLKSSGKSGGYANPDAVARNQVEESPDFLTLDEAYAESTYMLTELGGTIVNSVTLHCVQSPNSSESDIIYAVLTNNDKKVRIIDLEAAKVDHELSFEEPTNHASISPNGQFMVVVGDSRTVYFFVLNLEGDSSRVNGKFRKVKRFECGSQVPLPAIISSAFSPDSRYCAVASQDGYVAVFDMTRIEDGEEARVKEIRSTKVGPSYVAVRSILFSPAPWDILVWSEHTGRVSVADARSDFAVRQTVKLKLEGDDVVREEVSGITEDEANERFRRNMLEQAHRMVPELFPLYPEEEEEDENSDSSLPDSYESDTLDPPSRSRTNRESIYENMRALEARLLGSHSSRRSNPTNSNWFIPPALLQNLAGTSLFMHRPSERRGRDSNTSRPTAAPSLLRSIPPPAPSAPHSNTVSRQPSRRNVRQEHSEHEPNSSSSGPGLRITGIYGDIHLPLYSSSSSSSSNQQSVLPLTPTTSGPTSTLADILPPEARRRLVSRAAAPSLSLGDPSGSSGAGGGGSSGGVSTSARARRLFEDRVAEYFSDPNEIDISGVAVGVGGEALYVATQRGILEYKVNLRSRMWFGKVLPR